MKKVGILTFHYSNNNYGAVLQAYSIYKLIEDLGYQSYIIDFIPKKERISKKDILQAIFGFRFRVFRKHYLKRLLDGKPQNLKKLNNTLDTFIVGSDQVWRYRPNTKALHTYFLDFVDHSRKIAYGASFGVDSWEGPPATVEEIRAKIIDFNAISVREQSGVDICKHTFGVKSELVIDPTLVINKKHFDDMTRDNQSNSKRKAYLGYMLLDESEEHKQFFKNKARKYHLKFINIKGIPVNKKGLYIFNSPIKWLKLIKRADVIVTDSFHCTVFSIIFQKKFICLGNEKRGLTRLQNLLNLIGEPERLLLDLKNFDENLLTKGINYTKIKSVLDKEAENSIRYLKRSLTINKI